jgi:hypothetical protein
LKIQCIHAHPDRLDYWFLLDRGNLAQESFLVLDARGAQEIDPRGAIQEGSKSDLDDISALSTHRARLRLDRSHDANSEWRAVACGFFGELLSYSRCVLWTHPSARLLPARWGAVCKYREPDDAFSEFTGSNPGGHAARSGRIRELYLYQQLWGFGKNSMDHSLEIGPNWSEPRTP